MAGPAWQTRATDPRERCVEMAAYWFLSGIIGWSVLREKEFGGVIFHDSANDTIGGTGPIEGVTTTVDVGQHKFNFGLTGTLKVLAWYHTHPLKEKLDDKGNMMHFMWDKFEGGDKWISDDKRVLGFVGMMDGSFWRYDPAPEALDGKYGPGGWQKLNPRLPLKPATLLLPTEDRWSPAAPTLAPRPASGPSRTRRPPR